MTSPDLKNSVEKYLKKNPSIKKEIIDKIEKCLDECLFVSLNTCNKHELKGNCKGFWRLHVPHDHVVIYVIEGQRPDRYASVLKIMTEKEYHNWVQSC
ncbi:MAG: type II toxin-antitoxin system mRNA interferase toxin, RelE/StbE family [Methanomicrobium sp.]|nr:type II toxin-antitoxin system mRNA interferase toxin, RelE/StbE family [Methanomicrobium sp.]